MGLKLSNYIIRQLANDETVTLRTRFTKDIKVHASYDTRILLQTIDDILDFVDVFIDPEEKRLYVEPKKGVEEDKPWEL